MLEFKYFLKCPELDITEFLWLYLGVGNVQSRWCEIYLPKTKWTERISLLLQSRRKSFPVGKFEIAKSKISRKMKVLALKSFNTVRLEGWDTVKRVSRNGVWLNFTPLKIALFILVNFSIAACDSISVQAFSETFRSIVKWCGVAFSNG